MSTIVLVTKGKNDSVDYVKVVLFDNKEDANTFVSLSCTGKQKHWQHAEIVREDEQVDLCLLYEQMS